MEEELKKQKINSRQKLPAFLLSALVPGLGQLYNGKPKKFLMYSIGLLILTVGFNLLGLKPYFWAYFTILLLLIIFRLAIVIEATLMAYRTKEYELKSFNKWYIYLAITGIWYLVLFIGVNISKNTRYNTLKIHSYSGNPNLIAGDYVLGDFEFYKSKQPEYGDLVIFSTTKGGSFVFRIVGMPYDTIGIEKQLVKFKNKKSSDKFISTLFCNEYETEEFLETLPNGFKYRIYRNKTPIYAEKATIKEIVVPADSYFVLGDNRDLSDDSRFIGFVRREQMQGKLLSLYFRTDFSKINKSLSESE